MKKYKLIKEYPGSPELGTIVTEKKSPVFGKIYTYLHDMAISALSIENQPEYWEEIIELCVPIGTKFTDICKNVCKIKEVKGDSVLIHHSSFCIDYKINIVNKYFKEGSWKIYEEERYFKCLRPDDWAMTIKNNNGYLIFPGSFKAHITNVSILDHFKNSFYWKEVTKKEYEAQFLDYEILSFKSSTSIVLYNRDTQLKDTYCQIDGKYPFYTLEECLANKWTIHSVKRLSDGEIFTVGDKITGKSKYNCTINTIELNPDYPQIMFNRFDEGIDLINAKHIKKLLFKTEDDVDIFEGDKVYFINTTNQRFNIDICLEADLYKSHLLYFSTKEKAEEYIWRNKECLSYENVLRIYQNTKYAYSFIASLQNFIKEKLNMK